MLRLKRDAQNRVGIVWNRRTRSSRRLMWRAIFYSVVIHFVMLFMFQIKTQLMTQSSPSVTPIVLLDAEEAGIALLGDTRNSEEDPRTRLARELHLNTFSFMPRIQPTTQEIRLRAQMSTSPLPLVLPWPSSDTLSPSQHPIRIYPLKLILNHKLHTLRITNDGSSLFGKASPETIFFTSAFSEVLPQVDFHVEISLQTGRVVHANCSKELFDKRLQNLAERLLRTIRFAPSKEGMVSGTIAIQFAGTFDTISPFLEGSKP